MFKKPMLSLAAALFLVCSAGLVQAQTTKSPTPNDQPKTQTTTNEQVARVDRDVDWGWLGLIGLLGLAGLAGRRRDVVSTTRATNIRNEPI